MKQLLISSFATKRILLIFSLLCFCTADNFSIHGQSTDLSSGVPALDLDCGPDVFFTVGPNGAINRFHLSGGVVTFDTLLTTFNSLNSLAIGQNLVGAIPDPTFYGSTTISI